MGISFDVLRRHWQQRGPGPVTPPVEPPTQQGRAGYFTLATDADEDYETTSVGVYAPDGVMVNRHNIYFPVTAGTGVLQLPATDWSGAPLDPATAYTVRRNHANVTLGLLGSLGKTDGGAVVAGAWTSAGLMRSYDIVGEWVYVAQAHNEGQPMAWRFHRNNPQYRFNVGYENKIETAFSLITADETRVYLASNEPAFNNGNADPTGGSTTTFVHARRVDNDAAHVWSDDPASSVFSLPAILIDDRGTSYGATGISVQRGAANLLAVAFGRQDAIYAVDKVSGAGLYAWTAPGCRTVKWNGANQLWWHTHDTITLWDVSSGSPQVVYTQAGFHHLAVLSCHPTDTRLVYVYEAGEHQQYKLHNTQTGETTVLYGQLNGYDGTGPVYAQDKLHGFHNTGPGTQFEQNGCAVFEDGSFWGSNFANSEMLHVGLDGQMKTFVRQFGQAYGPCKNEADHASLTLGLLSMYTPAYDAAPIQAAATMTHFWGANLPAAYGDAYTGPHTNPIFTTICTHPQNGKVYGWLKNTVAGKQELVELNPAVGVVGTGFFFPYSTDDYEFRFLPADFRLELSPIANDPNHGPWQFGYLPATGFDAHGLPTWGAFVGEGTLANTPGTVRPRRSGSGRQRSPRRPDGNIVFYDTADMPAEDAGWHLAEITPDGQQLWQAMPSGNQRLGDNYQTKAGNATQRTGDSVALYSHGVAVSHLYNEYYEGGTAAHKYTFTGRFGLPIASWIASSVGSSINAGPPVFRAINSFNWEAIEQGNEDYQLTSDEGSMGIYVTKASGLRAVRLAEGTCRPGGVGTLRLTAAVVPPAVRVRVQGSRIVVECGPVPGATSYRFYRSTLAGGRRVLHATSTTPSAALTGLEPGRLWHLTVTALVAGVETNYSSEKKVFLPTAQPVQVAGRYPHLHDMVWPLSTADTRLDLQRPGYYLPPSWVPKRVIGDIGWVRFNDHNTGASRTVLPAGWALELVRWTQGRLPTHASGYVVIDGDTTAPNQAQLTVPNNQTASIRLTAPATDFAPYYVYLLVANTFQMPSDYSLLSGSGVEILRSNDDTGRQSEWVVLHISSPDAYVDVRHNAQEPPSIQAALFTRS